MRLQGCSDVHDITASTITQNRGILGGKNGEVTFWVVAHLPRYIHFSIADSRFRFGTFVFPITIQFGTAA